MILIDRIGICRLDVSTSGVLHDINRNSMDGTDKSHRINVAVLSALAPKAEGVLTSPLLFLSQLALGPNLDWFRGWGFLPTLSPAPSPPLTLSSSYPTLSSLLIQCHSGSPNLVALESMILHT